MEIAIQDDRHEASRAKRGISACLTLLFAPGHRPDAAAVSALAARPRVPGKMGGFAVTHQAMSEGWVELLTMGLTFDLSGLSPGPTAATDHYAYRFGIDKGLEVAELEPLSLRPGPHLAAGSVLLPVVRAMLNLAAELAAFPGVRAIGWEPARSLMAPDFFVKISQSWLDAGAFPALGLTALARSPDGAIRSEGLAFFLGYELLIEPQAGETPATSAKLAVRLIHQLVEQGGIDINQPLRGPNGEVLNHLFTEGRQILRVWQDT